MINKFLAVIYLLGGVTARSGLGAGNAIRPDIFVVDKDGNYSGIGPPEPFHP